MTDLELEDVRQLRVLVVDDCEDIRDVFCSVVERAGHRPRAAGDGVKALDILQRESFDLMLLDLSMPRMGGVEVACWLQAHPGVAPDMRVVVVTARDDDMNLLFALGVTTVLMKPLVLHRLKVLMIEVARDSSLLGQIPLARVDFDQATGELDAALSTFDSAGAVPDSVRARELLVTRVN